MATQTEIARLMAIMALAWPRYELRKESIDVYSRILEDIPLKTLELAAKHLMATSTFFPSIAEWRKASFDIQFNAVGMPTPFEAWQLVMSEVRRVGSYASPRFDNDLVARATAAIGWRTICLSEEPEYTRAHFVKAYEALLKRSQETASLLPEVRRAMESAPALNAGAQMQQLSDKLDKSK